MAIHNINGEHTIFVEFQNLGVAFVVRNNKLELAAPSEDETPVTELNCFLTTLRRWIKTFEFDLKKIELLHPVLEHILSNVDKDDPRHDDMHEAYKIAKEMSVKAKGKVVEAEALLLDVMDLMQTYNIPVLSEGDVENEGDVAAAKMQQLVNKIRGMQ